MQPGEPISSPQPEQTPYTSAPPLPHLQQQQPQPAPSYDTPPVSLEKSRLLAVVVLVIGIVLAVILKNTHDSGGSLSEKMVIFTPVLLLLGIAGAIWPRLMLVGRRDAPAQPPVYRVMAILIGLLGAGLGFLIRYTLFADWK